MTGSRNSIGSYLSSIISLLKMFNVTCIVLANITKKETTTAQRDADTTSFEFVFILHKVLDMTDDLCQAL